MNFLPLLVLTFLSFLAIGGSYPDAYRYQILPTDPTTSTVTENGFTQVPSKVLRSYEKKLKELRIAVVVRADWERPFFTAWSNKDGDSLYSLNFWGGLARIPGMNEEGHALIACHELGHILGGPPKMRIPQFTWASSEGQADFFSSKECLRKYFFQKKAIADVPGAPYTLCRTRFSKEQDFRVCLLTMKGIEAFGRVLSHLSQYEQHPAIETPTDSVAGATLFDSYPDPQCRLDTLVRGALDLARPLCWFRPSMR